MRQHFTDLQKIGLKHLLNIARSSFNENRLSDNLEKIVEWIEEKIKRFMTSRMNTLNVRTGEPAWAEPLVGFSNGADPLFQFYKEDIGEFYLSPLEFFAHRFPEVEVLPEQLTVITWILPQTEATKADHRQETHLLSERWARTRYFGEQVNDELRKYIVEFLKLAEVKAVAPALSSIWERKVSERYDYASTWSERHAAYAAGLGTFSLSDGLITPMGKAIRVGSVIAKIDILPNKRPYTHHNAYCLFYVNGTCGKCIDRCPIGAITEKGHDKILCAKYGRMLKEYVLRHFIFGNVGGRYGCGFCQTGVPCESGIPKGIET